MYRLPFAQLRLNQSAPAGGALREPRRGATIGPLVIPGQAQGSELGTPPLGVERVGEVRSTEEEGEATISHGKAQCGQAEGNGRRRSP